MTEYELNQQKNKEHYEKVYANYNLKNILYWLNNLEGYLDFVTSYETSWFALYQSNFRNRIKGKRVLEMGCGDCNNAAVMAALGAKVYANDIASTSGKIVEQLNDSFDFLHPIVFVEGDFLNNDMASGSFDFVIGKAFLHHLTIPVEREFLKETARLLKPDGEARFFEPAVNSKLLDALRWYIPIGKRPSKFRGEAFRKWKEEDPHPDRSFSTVHFKSVVSEFFEECHIMPVGTMDRFRNLIKNRKWNGRYAKWALKNEQKLPLSINSKFARSQLIICVHPSTE